MENTYIHSRALARAHGQTPRDCPKEAMEKTFLPHPALAPDPTLLKPPPSHPTPAPNRQHTPRYYCDTPRHDSVYIVPGILYRAPWQQRTGAIPYDLKNTRRSVTNARFIFANRGIFSISCAPRRKIDSYLYFQYEFITLKSRST